MNLYVATDTMDSTNATSVPIESSDFPWETAECLPISNHPARNCAEVQAIDEKRRAGFPCAPSYSQLFNENYFATAGSVSASRLICENASLVSALSAAFSSSSVSVRRALAFSYPS